MKTLSEVKLNRHYQGRPGIASLRVASAVKAHETVTIGTRIYEASIDGTVTLPSNKLVDVSASSALAAATGTLTSDATNVTDGDTVTIGTQVYRLKSAIAQINDVLIGASADATLLNLIHAINGTGTPGTDYFLNTLPNASVTAASSVTSHAFVITAKVKGTAANAVATTETSSHLSFGGATLSGGADAAAADFTTALNAVINADQVALVRSERISANEILVRTKVNGAQVGTTETLSGANNAWASTTTYGERGNGLQSFVRIQRAANAAEVALGVMHFVLPDDFVPTSYDVTVVGKAWGGTTSVVANRITLTNTGSTDFAANDVVKVTAAD